MDTRDAGRKGGNQRAENLSREELIESARKAGKQGGKARAKKLTPEQRTKSAKKAANARWERYRRENPFKWTRKKRRYIRRSKNDE